MNKKISLIVKFIIILSILVLAYIGYLAIEHNYIPKVQYELKKEEETTPPVAKKEIEYRVLDNTDTNIKGVLTIFDPDGIQDIEYIDTKGEKIVLNCYGKSSVSMDYNTILDTKYDFKVTTPNNTKTLNLTLTQKDIDGYIQISPGASLEEYNTASIEYNNVEPVTKYYKIGDFDDNWIQYTDEIDISYLHYTGKDSNQVKIYAKEVDPNGNTIINNKILEISSDKKRKLDIFSHFEKYEKTGMTLQDYGFSVVSTSNAQTYGFEKRYFCAGHWYHTASWSGVFKLDFTKQLKASNFESLNGSQLIAGFIYYIQNGKSSCYSNIEIHYEDGTSETISPQWGGKAYDCSGDIKGKKINHVLFNIWGYDGDASSSYGYLRDLEIVGIEQPIAQAFDY